MQDRIVFHENDRVQLVQLREEDARVLVDFVNDYAVRGFIGKTKPTTLEQEKEWIKRRKEKMKDAPTFGIKVVNAELIGTMSLNRVDTINMTATTGAMIGDKKYWGKGFGTDAKMLLLEHAFDERNLRIVYAKVYSSNSRSIAYCRKCGYEKVAELPKKHFVRGKYVDEIILQATPDSWRLQYEKWQNGGL